MEKHISLIGAIFILVAAFVYLTCAGRQDPGAVDVVELSENDLLDISELTPTETKRLGIILNREVSPCGDHLSLGQALVNRKSCPLAPLAVQYVIEMLKKDFNEDEVSAQYLKRYAAIQGLDIAIDGSPVLGPDDAIVTIVEFSDFECPFCERTSKQIKKIQAEYPEHIKVVFKHMPLESIHPTAMLAAKAAYAAHRQEKFWDMHDTLFSAQGSPLSKERIQTMAIGLGLDADKFEEDMDSPGATAAIGADKTKAEQLGVNSTPVLFVNGRELKEGVKGLKMRLNEEFLRHFHGKNASQ